jgi:uncharacterized protein (TIGR00255 family)
MIHSMTAIGQAEGRVLEKGLRVEIRSVNHRFRDIIVHLPRTLIPLEARIRKIVAERVSRGRVEVRLQIEEIASVPRGLKLDIHLAKRYLELLTELKEKLGLGGEVDVSLLAGQNNIFLWEEEEIDLEAFMAGFEPLLMEALKNFLTMRAEEGRALSEDFISRLRTLATLLATMESLRESVTLSYRDRLQERVRALTGGFELDQARLLEEVAYLADRSDITEEITRLKSHINQFEALLAEGGAVGRRLDFLLQEMNREANTISSKAQDVTLTQAAVDMKSELEKLREQVQNIE